MSEEYNDNLRRRRRSRSPEETVQPAGSGVDVTGEKSAAFVSETRDAAEAVRNEETAWPEGKVQNEGTARNEGMPRNEAVRVMGPDNRVPAEARRMSAAPYGAVNAVAARRPGTRQVQDVRRPAVRQGQGSPQRGRNGGNASRIGVGYAPGRMNIQNVRPGASGGQGGERVYSEQRYPTHTRQMPSGGPAYGMNGRDGRDGGEKDGSKKKLLIILASLLGIALAVFIVLKTGLLDGITGRKQQETTADRINDQDETENPALSGDVSADPEKNSMEAGTTDVLGSISLSQPEDTLPDEESSGGETQETQAVPESSTPETQETADGNEPELPGNAIPDEVIPDADASETQDVPGDGAQDPEQPDEGSLDEVIPDEGTPEDEPEDEPEDPDAADTEVRASDDTDTADPDAPADEAAAAEEPVKPLVAQAAPGANPDILTTKVYDGKNVKKEYSRLAKEQVHMQPGWEYTRHNLGVITFRGNAFRTNGAVGKVASAEELEKVWEVETGSLRGSSQTYYGSGWPGQPAIVWWPKEIREQSNIDEEKKTIKNMKEVIVPVQDGTIRFLNLADGSLTRNSIKVGYPMAGTPSLHPGGFPYMTAGQSARKLKNKTGKIGLRQYNMYSLTELTPLIDGLDGKLHRAPNNVGSFETSALIDRKSDTMITAGTNGMLYLTSLNCELDYNLALFTYKPDTVVAICMKKKEKAAQTAVESSIAMYDKYVYYADMGGILRCVDTDFLTPVWAVETGDSVMAAVALDQPDSESLDLYTANMLNLRKKGSAQIRRYDALSGSEIWCTEIGVQKDTKNKTAAGCKASPVIGENNLSGLVFYTVTGLSEEGRTALRVPEETKAALVALSKETGKIEWAYALSDRSDSSPIAVYDEDGNGRIIQCAWDGTIVMVDGLSGQLVNSIHLEANIEASPAAFDDMMVIGTTGKGTSYIFGIRIK